MNLTKKDRLYYLTVIPGDVPPFSFHEQLELLVDPSLLQNEEIVFNAGRLDRSVYLGSAAYQSMTNPKIAEITTEMEA